LRSQESPDADAPTEDPASGTRAILAQDSPAAPSPAPSRSRAYDPDRRVTELRAAAEAIDEARRKAAAIARGLEDVLSQIRLFSLRVALRTPAAQGRARTVLVVDDVAEMRELYALELGTLGFRVELAADGKQAIAKAIETRPDAIVMDYAMPTMDGAEAVGWLASDERTRQIPVLMLSAIVEHVPIAARLRCAATLAKPCSPDELGRLLDLTVAARVESRHPR
jgi:CheY-like chemotaxis protein